MKKYLGTLVFIAVLFIVGVRLYKIASAPPSVYWDEASIGYNAYSILKTGKDEWGNSFPSHFKAFEEYKLPVYIYSVVPYVWLFGLNEYSVRLPAIDYTLLSMLFIYLLASKVTGKRVVGLMALAYFSISPWYFIFSRTGYEATAGLAFFLGSIYFFVKSLKQSKYLLLSSVFSLLSFYSYNSFRILVPFCVFVFLTIFIWKKIKTLKKEIFPLLVSAVILCLGVYPAYSLAKKENSLSRFWTVGLKVENQKKLTVFGELGANYLKHFSFDFLISKGDANPRSQQPGFGQLYLTDLLFISLGLVFLWRKNRLLSLGLFGGFLITLLPSAITREAPHALRAIAAVPFVSLFVACGIYYLYQKVNSRKILYLVAAVYLLFFGRYFFNFVSVYPQKYSSDWQGPYKDIFTKYNLGNEKRKVWVSDRYGQPYIFALFYLKYDPEKFRSEVKYNTDIRRATSLVYSFGNFIFRDVDFNKLEKGTLVFTTPTDKIDELSPKEVGYFKDGTPSYYVYEY